MNYFHILLAIAPLLAATAAQYGPNVLPLYRREPVSPTVNITASESGTIFDVEVQFGNQTFLLLFDTGSSDTWVVQTGFECTNGTDNSELPESACKYSNVTYDISSTFEPIDSEWFGVQYGTGIATGITGYEDVTLGGITVKRQQVGIVNSSVNTGDGINSGIVGFGYPSLTSAHPNSYGINESLLFGRISYNPLFKNMYEQGSVEQYFSIAIERTPYNSRIAPGGYLTLGSLPPVPHTGNFSVVPVEITDTIPLSFTNDTAEITEWTLSISETVYGNDNTAIITNSTAFQAVVDSGNPYNLFPAPLAQAINDEFNPPGTLDPSTGIYTIDCNATALDTLGVKIGNQIFYHNSLDLIIPLGDNSCVSAIAATIPGDGVTLNFLGDAFLKNVVAVFDFGRDEMRFAARVNGLEGMDSGYAADVSECVV